MAELSGAAASIWRVLIAPDGSTVFANTEDGTVLAWPTSGGEARRFQGHHGPVYSAAISADGTRVLTGGYDNTIREWDPHSASELLTLRGHIGSLRATTFSPNGRAILSASDDGAVRLWRADAIQAPSR